MEEKRKVIFSGIQPSGNLTLGNYIGALRNFVALQHEYECYYCVVDMHAITVRQDPADLRRRTMELAAIYLAAGVDPERCTLFVQSHVGAHAELSWILECHSYMGELSRMTQFKEKSAKQGSNIGCGLFTYPVLMASDILLYQSDLVPVGEDQKQHLELARDIAIRFNNLYSPTFTVPEPYISKVGGRIMSLTDPKAKMSKSGEPNSFIALMDPPDVIRRKIRRAVTDLDGEIRYDPENKPGVSNLLSIYAGLNGVSVEEAASAFKGMGYGQLKDGVADVVCEKLEPLQAEAARILSDKAELSSILNRSAERAARTAYRTLRKVQKKVGFLPMERS